MAVAKRKKAAKRAPAKKRVPKPLKSSPRKPRKPRVLGPQDYFASLKGEGYSWYSDELSHVQSVNEWIPTGSLALDRLLAGGWPIGRISEVAAWENVGKTSLLDQGIAMAQAINAVPVLLETEQGRDRAYSQKLGVDPARVLVPDDVETIEDVFEAVDQVLAVQRAKQIDARNSKHAPPPPPMLLVWDALGGTPTKAELAGDPADKHWAVASKVVKMNFRRLNQQLTERRAAFVFANHFYKDERGRLVTYGGGGPRYMTSLRVWLSRTGSIKIGSQEVGHTIEAKVRKTRIGIPPQPVEMGFVWGGGIDNSWTLYDWGKRALLPGTSTPIVESKGRYSYLNCPKTGEVFKFEKQFMGLGEVLRDNPETYAALAGGYRAA